MREIDRWIERERERERGGGAIVLSHFHFTFNIVMDQVIVEMVLCCPGSVNKRQALI